MDQISADLSTWQPALLGVNHLHEVATHFTFESQPIRDFLGFGANLQIRAVDGTKYSLAGDVFIRFVPRPFHETPDVANIAIPDSDPLTRTFDQAFPPSASGWGALNDMTIDEVSRYCNLPMSTFYQLKSRKATSQDLPPLVRVDTPHPNGFCAVRPADLYALNTEEKPVGATEIYLSSTAATTPPDATPVDPRRTTFDLTINAPTNTPTNPSIATHGSVPSLASEGDGAPQVSMTELMHMNPRSVYPTPPDSPSPDAPSLRYFDTGSDFDALMASLPVLSASSIDTSHTIQEEVVNDEVAVIKLVSIEVPDDAALGGGVVQSTSIPGSPLQSELLNTPRPTSFVKDPLSGSLKVHCDALPGPDVGCIPSEITASSPVVTTDEAVAAIISIDPSRFREPATASADDSSFITHPSGFKPSPNTIMDPCPAGPVRHYWDPVKKRIRPLKGIPPPYQGLLSDYIPQRERERREAAAISAVNPTPPLLVIPALLPPKKDKEDDDMDQSIPDLEAQIPSPLYVPRSPTHPPENPYVPMSPLPPSAQVAVDRITTSISTVEMRIDSLENQAALSSSHLCDIRGNLDTASTTIEDLRNCHADTRSDLANRKALVDGAVSHLHQLVGGIRAETEAIKELVTTIRGDVTTSQHQISELVWLYERVQNLENAREAWKQPLRMLSDSVHSTITRRNRSDHLMTGFKKEIRGKVDEFRADVARINRALDAQSEQGKATSGNLDQMRKSLEAAHRDWTGQFTTIRGFAERELGSRVLNIERAIANYIPLAQSTQLPYPLPSLPLDAGRHHGPQVSANTVQQVLSALMSTTSRPVTCAA